MRDGLFSKITFSKIKNGVKKSKGGTPVWMNKELITGLRDKKKGKRRSKQGQGTPEEYKDIEHAGMALGKLHLVGGKQGGNRSKNKPFYRYINRKRTGRKCPLLTGLGIQQ